MELERTVFRHSLGTGKTQVVFRSRTNFTFPNTTDSISSNFISAVCFQSPKVINSSSSIIHANWLTKNQTEGEFPENGHGQSGKMRRGHLWEQIDKESGSSQVQHIYYNDI